MAKTTNMVSTGVSGAAVTTAFSDVLSSKVTGYTFASVQVKNTGSVAFNDFKVQARDHSAEEAEWYDYILGADLDCIDSVGVALDITTLAGSDIAHLEIPIGSKAEVRLVAKCGTSTTCDCVGTFADGADGSALQSLLTSLNIIARSSSSATDESGDIGSESTEVLEANASRHFATFVNNSIEDIYLKLGATAVMNEGIRLNSGGGSYTITTINLYTGAVSAICSSGSKNLVVQES